MESPNPAAHDQKFPAYDGPWEPAPYVPPEPAPYVPQEPVPYGPLEPARYVNPAEGIAVPSGNRFSGGLTPWSSGLFGCFDDVSNCCITCCCPCITFGQIAEIVDKGTTSCVTAGAVYALISWLIGGVCMYCCCGCIYSYLYRSRMRNQYMLKESPCGDCLVHCCCEPCALCQEYRELKSHGFDVPVGWQANMDRQTGGVAMAPVVQGGMSR